MIYQTVKDKSQVIKVTTGVRVCNSCPHRLQQEVSKVYICSLCVCVANFRVAVITLQLLHDK